MQVFIEGGVAAFRNEHTLVWLLASASRAESEAIGCEIYFGRVVLLVGQVAAEQAKGAADAGATRNEAGYGGVRDALYHYTASFTRSYTEKSIFSILTVKHGAFHTEYFTLCT